MKAGHLLLAVQCWSSGLTSFFFLEVLLLLPRAFALLHMRSGIFVQSFLEVFFSAVCCVKVDDTLQTLFSRRWPFPARPCG